MKLSRRRALQVTGASLSGMALTGCVSSADRDAGSTDTDAGGDDTDDGSDPTETTDDRSGESPRVDEPPYEITEPECGEDSDRDPLWLCENMPAEPSVAFEQVESSTLVFADEGLRQDEQGSDDQYYATFLTESGDRDRLHDEASGSVVGLVEGTDFDSEAVLVVQTGWGSGSETPHLERIEETEGGGIHAFGCSRRPCIVTSDVTVRTVAARFERPGTLDDSVVSLTVGPERRVTFGANVP